MLFCGWLSHWPQKMTDRKFGSYAHKMNSKHLVLIAFTVCSAAAHLSQVLSFPCGTCPKRIIIESSCGVSEECEDSPTEAPPIATTETAKGNGSSAEEGEGDEETGTERTAILAVAIRTLSNGSDERCSSSDCNSNGICFGTPSTPLCLCFKGFCGPLCKHAFCPGHSGCNGHGWCLANSDSAKCVCQTNFWGKHCEKSKKDEEKDC